MEERLLHAAVLAHGGHDGGKTSRRSSTDSYKQYGDIALHLAARQGHYDVVVALINAAKSSIQKPESTSNASIALIQSQVSKKNMEHETPLHDAVRYNHNNVVQLLVNEAPNAFHCQNKRKESPLYLASTRCNIDIITTILCTCVWAVIGDDGPAGRTALHAVVLDDGKHDILRKSECVKLLTDKRKYLIEEQDDNGWTVFHYVACNDLYTIVENLVSEDCKSAAYVRDKKYKRTALHVAAYKGNVRVMEKLVQYFPDCWDMVDKNCQNIMHIAVEQDRKEVIRYILSQGCKAYGNLLMQRDKDGNTPLHLITKLGCYVQELMDERTIDWEVLNGENGTPLDHLIHRGKETAPLTDQAMLRRTLVDANVKKHWHFLQALEEGYTQNEEDTKEVELYKRWISTHMVVAALITTVALTAGFAMPGGFDGNQGQSQGSAVLLRKTSFEAFIVTDTIALICSMSSLFLFFMTTMYEDVGRVRKLFFIAVLLNTASIITITVAFITGTYSVLDHSSALAISIIVIACSFLGIAFLVFISMLITVTRILAADISDSAISDYLLSSQTWQVAE
nr:PREDICTED: protein ACCELERATED CELL DEATH 6-like isoform X2 [Daucus carota subsp. sativus]